VESGCEKGGALGDLRTTNLIESPFSTVRLRQRVTKGAGTRRTGPTMAFKLLAMAEQRRKLNGAHPILLVRAGLRPVDHAQAERQHQRTSNEAV